MKTLDILLNLFWLIDDKLKDVKKHSQSQLYPSEIILIGVLYALKGGNFRHFYRWLKREDGEWFPHLPDRTRLLRQLKVYEKLTDRFLAEPSFFTVADTYGVELIHPIREGRSKQQLGKKGKSNKRWIVGVKLGWVVNRDGYVVTWRWSTANISDKYYGELAADLGDQTIVLTDLGFRSADGIPPNLKLCQRGTWNERGIIETVFSTLTQVCHLKKITQRVQVYVEARFSYIAALFNLLLRLAGTPEEDRMLPALAEFAL